MFFIKFLNQKHSYYSSFDLAYHSSFDLENEKFISKVNKKMEIKNGT